MIAHKFIIQIIVYRAKIGIIITVKKKQQQQKQVYQHIDNSTFNLIKLKRNNLFPGGIEGGTYSQICTN